MLSSCPFHDGNVGYLGTLQNSLVSAASQDKDPMRKPHHFLEIRADDDDGHAGLCQVGDSFVDGGPCSHVDSPGWFIENKDLRSARNPASDNDLLLIAAGEITHQSE